MNDDKLKGKTKQVEGEIKDRVGGALGRNDTKAEGKAEKVVGRAQEKLGDLKDRLAPDRDPDVPDDRT